MQKKIIIIGFIIGITVLITLILFLSKSKQKWACSNGKCTTSSTGTYTDEASCKTGCNSSLKKWACSKGTCTTSTSGTYANEASCRTGCQTYQCDPKNPGQCIPSPVGTTGQFISMDVCQNACTPDYCGRNDSKVYACSNDKDCGPSGLCNKKDQDLLDKRITDVGYCVPGTFMPQDTNCVDKLYIGQDTNNGLSLCTQVSRADPSKMGLVSRAGVGLNANYQCDSKPCATYGICDTNKWLAKINATGDNCSTQLCCDSTHTAVGPTGTKFCCNEKDPNCYNTTQYGYSKNMAGISGTVYTDTQACKSDQDCAGMNTSFLDTLKVGDFVPSSDMGSPNYASLFCDAGVCKAKCGYVDGPSIGDVGSYIKIDDSNVSYCAPRNNKCQFSPVQTWESGIDAVNKIPICYKDGTSATGPYYWTSADDSSVYKTAYSVDLNTSDPTCIKPNMCMEYGSKTDGVYKVETTPSGCKFTVDCNNLSVIPAGSDTTISSKWTDLKQYIKTNNINPSKFTSKIAQTGPYTADSSTNTCPGNLNGFNPALTISPQAFQNNQCNPAGSTVRKNIHLNPLGLYCNTIDPFTGLCL